jgi:hypothetical protein
MMLKAWLLAGLSMGTAAAQTSIPLPGERAFPENIASSADGTAYVTNTMAPHHSLEAARLRRSHALVGSSRQPDM